MCSPTIAAEPSEESEEVRRVEGRVLDHEGKGVAKADVWLPVRYIDPKTTAHCQTDEDGQFVLEVPVGRVAGRVISDDPKWARGVRFYLTTTADADGTTGTAMTC